MSDLHISVVCILAFLFVASRFSDWTRGYWIVLAAIWEALAVKDVADLLGRLIY